MASLEERDQLINDEDFNKKLLLIAYGKVGNIEDAKDLVQDVLLDLWEKSDEQIKNALNLEAFVVQMIKNQATSLFNKRINVKMIEPDKLSSMGQITDPVHKLDLSIMVKAINSRKKATENLIFNLHFCNGVTDKEISTITGKKAGNVRRKIFDIRAWAKSFYNK